MAEETVRHGREDDNEERNHNGAELGGIGGAVVGGIAGSMAGPLGTVTGALIGGIVGAVTSGAIVNVIDKIDDDRVKGTEVPTEGIPEEAPDASVSSLTLKEGA